MQYITPLRLSPLLDTINANHLRSHQELSLLGSHQAELTLSWMRHEMTVTTRCVGPKVKETKTVHVYNVMDIVSLVLE